MEQIIELVVTQQIRLCISGSFGQLLSLGHFLIRKHGTKCVPYDLTLARIYFYFRKVRHWHIKSLLDLDATRLQV